MAYERVLLESVGIARIREALDPRLRKCDALAQVEKAWQCFAAGYLAERKLDGDRTKLASEELRAARIGCKAGLDVLLAAFPQSDDYSNETDAFKQLKTDVYATDADVRSRLVMQSALSSYVDGIRGVADADELIRLTKNYFSSVAGTPEKKRESITFKDIAGNSAAKRELMAIAEDVRHAETFAKYNLNPLDASVLLVGPPGCGKTYLVKAFANEVDLPFHHVQIPDVLSCMYGKSAQNLRRQLDVPGVVFLDEIDALGRARNANTHEATASLVTTMCTELDGVGTRHDRILLAATNLEEMVDPALKRPPRLSRIIRMELPTSDELVAAVHIHRRKYETNVKLAWAQNDAELKRLLHGKSYADVAEMVKREAVSYARKEYLTPSSSR
jgi:hypothetical protein